MEETSKTVKVRHRGRIGQVPIYLGKLFRMFFYMDDWKCIPMSAVIAALVAFVAASGMFKNMEGTLKGALALSCVCIWNGFFNSIQVVCRERDIIKREHRNGMHISSYLCAHMIFQALLCLVQVVITIAVCYFGGMKFGDRYGYIITNFMVEIGITMFILTYSADMLSLMLSCIAKNTTAAMTMMPFMLIFELLFSDTVFELPSNIKKLADLSIAKWGITAICSQSNYNSQPMISVWNMLSKFWSVEVNGRKPIYEIMKAIEDSGNRENFNATIGYYSQKADYVMSRTNILNCWMVIIMFTLIFMIVAILALENVDKDKR